MPFNASASSFAQLSSLVIARYSESLSSAFVDAVLSQSFSRRLNKNNRHNIPAASATITERQIESATFLT